MDLLRLCQLVVWVRVCCWWGLHPHYRSRKTYVIFLLSKRTEMDGMNANVIDPLLSSWERSIKQIHETDEFEEACAVARDIEKQ